MNKEKKVHQKNFLSKKDHQGLMETRSVEDESIEIPEERAGNLQSSLQSSSFTRCLTNYMKETELITEGLLVDDSLPQLVMPFGRSQYPRQDIESRLIIYAPTHILLSDSQVCL